ncbi:MAG: hypothetical protein ACE5IR_02465 [bacterium]
MGQQQLLLVTLSAIVVGISVFIGIHIFMSGSAQSNQDAVVHDLLTIATRAQEYYRRPVMLGGGGFSYANLTTPEDIKNRLNFPTPNANGSYSVFAAGTVNGVSFQGIGLYDQNGDNTPITIQVQVTPESTKTNLINR